MATRRKKGVEKNRATKIHLQGIELVKKACEHLGYKVRLMPKPWCPFDLLIEDCMRVDVKVNASKARSAFTLKGGDNKFVDVYFFVELRSETIRWVGASPFTRRKSIPLGDVLENGIMLIPEEFSYQVRCLRRMKFKIDLEPKLKGQQSFIVPASGYKEWYSRV